MAEPAPPCRVLDWDSEFFGLRIGRVAGDRTDEPALAAATAWADERSLDCVYLLADCTDAAGLRAASSRGFRPVDVRLDFGRPVGDDRPAAGGLRHAREADLATLAPLARGAFAYSRFAADGRFPAERCETLFEIWLTDSVRGRLADFVLVDDGLEGFVCCTVDADQRLGRIELIAVVPDRRGDGLGGALVDGALDELARRGAGQVRVATQAASVPAQRLYQRAGFRTLQAAVWLHRWRDEARLRAPDAHAAPSLSAHG
jgi:dTDP-4-amino-4,6-dideoxy-D-galactose acyltransferase